MNRLVSWATSTLVAFAMIASCTEDPVVLATIPALDGGSEGGSNDHMRRCISTWDCPTDAYCERPSCFTPAGVCRPYPAVCPNEEMPVCGCNGVTYFNDCLRRAAGVPALDVGECEVNALTCFGQDDCPDGGSCARLVGSSPEMTCGPNLPGRCWALPSTCPAPTRSDRWDSCEPIAPAHCVDTCNAIRSELPHRRAGACP